MVENFNALKAELLGAVQTQRICSLALWVLQRQHTHTDQVATVNALEALSDNDADSKQARALSCPVSRGPRAVLFTGECNKRDSLLSVVLGCVKDECLRSVALREVPGVASLNVS